MSLLKLAESQLLVNDIPAQEALADIEITNRFIKLAQSIRKLVPKSDQFIYFSTIMLTAAEASLIDQKTGEPKKDRAGKVITGGFDENWKWSCSDPSIDPYSNQNLDIFPEAELKKAYKKWQGRPLCVDHRSSEVEGVRGVIIDTHYDEKYKRVVGLVALDKVTYPDLAHKVRTGYANSTSMGTAVGRALCTVCQKAAITEKDYCDCIRNKKGQRVNGVKVAEINLDLNPIELSLVVTPADPQAKVLKIIASLNNYTDQRNTLMETKDRVQSEKLTQLDNSIHNIESQLNRLFNECSDSACQFVRGEDGHIKLIKTAQETPASWSDYFTLASQVDSTKGDSATKANLLSQMDKMRGTLDIQSLAGDNLLALLDVLKTNDPELKEKLFPIVEEYKTQMGAAPALQDHQFTTPSGPDKDLGLDAGPEVTMPQNEQESGGRMGKVVNPSESGAKPNKGGDLGPELGSPSDRFQFGNMASTNNEAVKTANIDENLDLLLRQTQDIEKEMNTMKEKMNGPTNTSLPSKATNTEDFKMNEARLKLRAAQRAALLQKQADKEEEKCEKCGEKHEGECKAEKKAYWLGTTEPKPGQVQYKPENGGEPKIRMNDKQMHQDKSMGGADGSFPGDEAEKKKLLRAELEQRALERRAWWLGTEEPTPGKPKYKPDNGGEPKNRMHDKQMYQDKSMGGADGAFPGDEAEKKKLLRAELVPGILRTKFTKVRNADGSYNKTASYFEIFAGENKLLKATAEEIYGDTIDAPAVDEHGSKVGKTNWELLSSPEYGKAVMSEIRSNGFEKVAYLLKGAQAAMPEMPPAMEGAGAPAGELPPPAPGGEPTKTDVDANELMSLVGTIEDTLSKLKTEITGEDEGEVKDMSVETKEDGKDKEMAEAAGAELTAQIEQLGREIHADLDRSADELALLVDYFQKSASLDADKKQELNKLAAEAIEDSKNLLDEAETILAVAGKVPAGLKAYQDKQKGKKKDKGDEKGKKDEDKGKEKGKKEEKGKDKDKKDEKKKDKKKSKKAELAEALLKLAAEVQADDVEESTEEPMVATAEQDDLDKEMAELGLLPKNDAADETCGMCGMAHDKDHACTASAKDELVKEALAARKAKREALLKSAEEKKYDVCPDTHGMIPEAHKGAEANTTTQLDIKPAGAGAVVEGLDKIHDAMMDAATAVPTGKQGAAQVEVKTAEVAPTAVETKEVEAPATPDVQETKEAEVKEILAASIKEKKAEEDKGRFRVKLRRAYDLGLQMQEKGMIPRTRESLNKMVDEVTKFDDAAFESFKRAVAATQPTVKTASVNVPQVGVREDNSQPGENAVDDRSLVDQLKGMW